MSRKTVIIIDYLNGGLLTYPMPVDELDLPECLEQIDNLFTDHGFMEVDTTNPDRDWERYYVSGAGGLELRVFIFPDYHLEPVEHLTWDEIMSELPEAFGE